MFDHRVRSGSTRPDEGVCVVVFERGLVEVFEPIELALVTAMCGWATESLGRSISS
jgi:hypothetical protein